MILACACGASLDDAPEARWSLAGVIAVYKHCQACGSHRAYYVDELAGRRVSLYADPATSEVWIDPSFGVCEFETLTDAFDVAPPNVDATLMRNGEVLARASSSHGPDLVWVVERPRPM